LPFLKYFFSSQDKVQQTDEIIFLLIPHIVRESLLTEENTRVIDSGTGQGIELRRGDPDKNDDAEDDEPAVESLNGTSPNVQTTSAANAASAMMGNLPHRPIPFACGRQFHRNRDSSLFAANQPCGRSGNGGAERRFDL